METITLILKIFAIALIVVIAAAFLIFLIKMQFLRYFYKNLKNKSLCSFYMNEERFIGRIFDIEDNEVKVEFLDTDNVINVKIINISNIYPPA